MMKQAIGKQVHRMLSVDSAQLLPIDWLMAPTKGNTAKQFQGSCECI